MNPKETGSSDIPELKAYINFNEVSHKLKNLKIKYHLETNNRKCIKIKKIPRFSPEHVF